MFSGSLKPSYPFFWVQLQALFCLLICATHFLKIFRNETETKMMPFCDMMNLSKMAILIWKLTALELELGIFTFPPFLEEQLLHSTILQSQSYPVT